MRIALPVEEKDSNLDVCVSFGRTPYFYIYDTENKTEEYIVNEAAEAQGGAGIKAAQIVIDNKVDAVIVPRLGQNAADVLNAVKIKIYKSEAGSVKSNAALLEEGKLQTLTKFHAGFHGHGGF